MFESARSLSTPELIEVAYYTRLALERWFGPEDLERTPILAGLACEPSPAEQKMAQDWLREIESAENRPIIELDHQVIGKYLGKLSDLVQRRMDAEIKPDKALGRRLLEELRRKVPVPA